MTPSKPLTSGQLWALKLNDPKAYAEYLAACRKKSGGSV